MSELFPFCYAAFGRKILPKRVKKTKNSFKRPCSARAKSTRQPKGTAYRANGCKIQTGFISKQNLFCSENSVSGVAETGNNIAVFVESFVKRGAIKINIGMSLRESFNSLGSGNEAKETD